MLFFQAIFQKTKKMTRQIPHLSSRKEQDSLIDMVLTGSGKTLSLDNIEAMGSEMMVGKYGMPREQKTLIFGK